MDRNIQYAIRKGYPIVKIVLTLEDAKDFASLMDLLNPDKENKLVNDVQNQLSNAIKALEA